MKKSFLYTMLLIGGLGSVSAAQIKKISITGIDETLAKNLQQKLNIKVGDNIQQSDLSNIVRTIYMDERFESVQASQEAGVLNINIQPKLYISEIVVTGSKQIPESAIKDNLKENGIAQGELLNKQKLEAFRQELIQYYHTIGYKNAVIETSIDTVSTGVAQVKLDIKENSNALVKTIQFEGNQHFSDKKLINEMQIKPDVSWWQLFSSSRFSQQRLDQDLSTLRDFYSENGFAKFQIKDVNVQFSDDNNDVALKIVVDEGQQYMLNNVTVVGDTSAFTQPSESLLSHIKTGKQFKGSTVSSIEKALKSELDKNGYVNSKVTVTPDFNDVNNKVDLIAVVEPGKRYYANSINFKGNNITKDETLRQEMRQMEGTWLSSDLLALGKARLERTGFFESVEVQTLAVPGSDDKLDVVYIVKERNTGSINFGVGFGSESGLSYQASVKQDNFLGIGSSIELAGTKNKYSTDVSLTYYEPYLTRDGVGLTLSAFYNDYDLSKSDISSSYTKTSYGLNARMSFPVNEHNAYYLGLGYIHNRLKDLQPEYNRALYLSSMQKDSWNIKTNDFNFDFGWRYNSFNRGFFPTKGSALNVGGQVTVPGSDNKYYNADISFETYYPLTDDHLWVFSSRMKSSYIAGFGGKEVPFYNLYSAGGIGTLRGFAYGSIGPKAFYGPSDMSKVSKSWRDYTQSSNDVIGGDVILSGSVEMIVPTPFVKNQTNVRSLVFVDAATVWNTKWNQQGLNNYQTPLSYGDPSNVRVSMGVGFQWNSPIGPLLFSYAKPLKKYEGDSLEAFQFSIGGSF